MCSHSFKGASMSVSSVLEQNWPFLQVCYLHLGNVLKRCGWANQESRSQDGIFKKFRTNLGNMQLKSNMADCFSQIVFPELTGQNECCFLQRIHWNWLQRSFRCSKCIWSTPSLLPSEPLLWLPFKKYQWYQILIQ